MISLTANLYAVEDLASPHVSGAHETYINLIYHLERTGPA